jgi:hypothetical protein
MYLNGGIALEYVQVPHTKYDEMLKKMKLLIYLCNRAKHSLKYRSLLLKDYFRSKMGRSNLVVTIFGSCRQDSISDYFSVTSIRDFLTYPHYSKEVIQAIEYCKSGGRISPSTLEVFRNKILGIPLNSPSKLQKEFQRTDVFVIEIASLLEYVKGDSFYHHIAIGSIDGIEIRHQNLDDLRLDLLRIVDLLSPKPVLFATHYSTQNTGKRFELILFLEQFCRSINSEVVNPSEMNKVWKSDILHEDEEVISHFSLAGHEIMSDRYREKILSLSANISAVPLVQKYKPGLVVNDYHGLGDFIFGSLRVHQEAVSRNRQAFIDISEHPLSKFFNSNFVAKEKEITAVLQESDSHLFGKANTIFTHLRPLRRVTLTDIDFVLRNVFDSTSEFHDHILMYKKLIDVNYKDYTVIHFRLGDEFMQKSDQSSPGVDSMPLVGINKFIAGNSRGKKVLIASDSSYLLNSLNDIGYTTLTGAIAHLGKENQDLTAIRDTLTQFMVFRDANEIIQVSNYGWGSGFSETAAILGQVRLSKRKLKSIGESTEL